MKTFFLAKHRWWLLGIIALTLLIRGGGYYVLLHTTCPKQFDVACEHYTDVLAAFTWDFFFKSILYSSALFFFLPARAFNWWRWFALIAIPLCVWNVVTTESTSSFLMSWSPQYASDLYGYLFFGASVMIAIAAVLYDLIKSRARGKQ